MRSGCAPDGWPCDTLPSDWEKRCIARHAVLEAVTAAYCILYSIDSACSFGAPIHTLHASSCLPEAAPRQPASTADGSHRSDRTMRAGGPGHYDIRGRNSGPLVLVSRTDNPLFTSGFLVPQVTAESVLTTDGHLIVASPLHLLDHTMRMVYIWVLPRAPADTMATTEAGRRVGSHGLLGPWLILTSTDPCPGKVIRSLALICEPGHYNRKAEMVSLFFSHRTGLEIREVSRNFQAREAGQSSLANHDVASTRCDTLIDIRLVGSVLCSRVECGSRGGVRVPGPARLSVAGIVVGIVVVLGWLRK
nr:hypothetical protein CFP56_66869 [Quercus suber]